MKYCGAINTYTKSIKWSYTMQPTSGHGRESQKGKSICKSRVNVCVLFYILDTTTVPTWKFVTTFKNSNISRLRTLPDTPAMNNQVFVTGRLIRQYCTSPPDMCYKVFLLLAAPESEWEPMLSLHASEELVHLATKEAAAAAAASLNPNKKKQK